MGDGGDSHGGMVQLMRPRWGQSRPPRAATWRRTLSAEGQAAVSETCGVLRALEAALAVAEAETGIALEVLEEAERQLTATYSKQSGSGTAMTAEERRARATEAVQTANADFLRKTAAQRRATVHVAEGDRRFKAALASAAASADGSFGALVRRLEHVRGLKHVLVAELEPAVQPGAAGVAGASAASRYNQLAVHVGANLTVDPATLGSSGAAEVARVRAALEALEASLNGIHESYLFELAMQVRGTLCHER